MIDEFALTPDVFSSTGYSKSEYKDMCLPMLRTALLGEATLVRNLCGGSFVNHCLSMGNEASELLRKLKTRNKLRQDIRHTNLEEGDPCSWCEEALASHKVLPLTGIVTSHAVKKQHRKNGLVAASEKLNSTDWWTQRRSSFDTGRNTDSYLEHLRPLLSHANRLMFIDPNLDPSQGNYREFHKLIEPTARRDPPPVIEIHRSFQRGDGKNASFPKDAEWKNSFAALHGQLVKLNLLVTVFFWEDFHYRCLITDIVGYLVDQGFDTTTAQVSHNKWARLDRVRREEEERIHERNVRPNALKLTFDIGQRQ